ncbi:unannotated protein [freshwater metagenome]|uniref:Unannotated protein n=1 Tax=freshwater metagenome TaxID=449393 RepID=A0A6J6K530_9ZZZZ
MRTTVPTAPRIVSAHTMSSSVHCAETQIPAAPSPTSAGVFGIARTTAVPLPAASCKVATLIPAAMERTRFAPAFASCAHVCAARGGFTAITPAEHGPISALVTTPGNKVANALRRSADSSTMVIDVAGQPAAMRPPTRAEPILPPPTNVIGWC